MFDFVCVLIHDFCNLREESVFFKWRYPLIDFI